ncbi:MAG TPA: ABC transporter permease [Candidatus Limnocylindrales bacterium]|nr:ABC transporter permease [Candidatus Limnocylindrales bacterium]
MWFPDRLRKTVWQCRSIVWIASWLVPRDRRTAWRSEQNRRFWHWCHYLSESGNLTSQNRLLVAQQCWATFPDAFWIRFDRERFYARWRSLRCSPATFLASLALGLSALVLASGFVTAARTTFSSPIPHPSQVVIVTLDGTGMNGKFSRTRSDTLLDLSSIWSKSKLVSGLTPFSWAPGNLLLQRRDLPVATARVGPEFFAALEVKAALGRIFAPADVLDCPNCVLLSDAVWQHEFNRDANIVGKTVTLDGTPRTVIGILPRDYRMISSGIAVWSLVDPAMLFTNFQRRVGAVARLRGDATAARVRLDLTDLTESAGYVHPSSQLQVTTVEAQTRRNLLNTIWLVLLATGCAMFVVILRRPANNFGRLPQGLRRRTTWIAFFLAKSALLLAISALASWCLVHWISYWLVGPVYPMVDDFSIWVFLPLAIAAMSWSVRDQQRRCRTCLRRLELPVEIGRIGSVLLNWAGIEMVCPQGHGVLYLPDSPANSLDRDRWSNLDESWSSLFRAD